MISEPTSREQSRRGSKTRLGVADWWFRETVSTNMDDKMWQLGWEEVASSADYLTETLTMFDRRILEWSWIRR